ncbi:HepT-like ribonuclease domain-containing protein [Azoarcus taiwanensis]|uniref:DUF86 domain-containing protein n=1 Tax=Azoarcus taiwanensis TaxID=666964 RepID=A0A972F7T7_9RHOO|nr:HepT-like ribonuclease domain-containing protein [Azoarcus taiwanensis]NMG03327.1 DUF86 domain-containing protein [Azoarcus taiwanensis]
MKPEVLKYIWDVRNAIDLIGQFIDGKTLNDYEHDAMLRSAVERQLEIIGEALNGLSRRDPDIASQITELPRIVAFRNTLIHGYATVDDKLVWGVVESKLPELQRTMLRLQQGS